MLCAIHNDQNDHMRTLAAGALGQIGPEAKAAVPYLKNAVKEGLGGRGYGKSRLDEESVRALKEIDPGAVRGPKSNETSRFPEY